MTDFIRHLSYRVYAELKSEASRTYMGVLWWVIEPLAFMGALYLVFANIYNAKGMEFMVFLLLGLVPWKWFSSTVTRSSTCITQHIGLISNNDINKLLFIGTAVISNTIKFMIVFLLLIVLLLSVGFEVTNTWWYVLAIIILQAFIIYSLSTLFAALMPVLPDMKFVIDNGLLLMFFVSGIFFDVSQINGPERILLELNPMLFILDSYRQIIIHDSSPDMMIYSIWFVIALLIYLVGLGTLKYLDKKYVKIYLG